MYWIEAHKEAIDYYKGKKANLVKEVDGIEIWKDAYGYFRLILEEWDGRILITSGEIRSLERAEKIASEMGC